MSVQAPRSLPKTCTMLNLPVGGGVFRVLAGFFVCWSSECFGGIFVCWFSKYFGRIFCSDIRASYCLCVCVDRMSACTPLRTVISRHVLCGGPRNAISVHTRSVLQQLCMHTVRGTCIAVVLCVAPYTGGAQRIHTVCYSSCVLSHACTHTKRSTYLWLIRIPVPS